MQKKIVQENNDSCRITFSNGDATIMRPKKGNDMQKKYSLIHTFSFALNIALVLSLYIINWKIELMPGWIAFIVAAVFILGHTLCWRAYTTRDAQMDYVTAEIIKSMPADVLIDIINERNDIKVHTGDNET